MKTEGSQNKSFISPKRYFSLREAARFCKCSEEYLLSLAKSDILRFERRNDQWLIANEDLEAYLQSTCSLEERGGIKKAETLGDDVETMEDALSSSPRRLSQFQLALPGFILILVLVVLFAVPGSISAEGGFWLQIMTGIKSAMKQISDIPQKARDGYEEHGDLHVAVNDHRWFHPDKEGSANQIREDDQPAKPPAEEQAGAVDLLPREQSPKLGILYDADQEEESEYEDQEEQAEIDDSIGRSNISHTALPQRVLAEASETATQPSLIDLEYVTANGTSTSQNLQLLGDVHFGSGIEVEGLAKFLGSAIVTENLTIGGLAKLLGALEVTETLTVGTHEFFVDATADGDSRVGINTKYPHHALDINGSAKVVHNFYLRGDAKLSENLAVVGQSDLTGILNADGGVYIRDKFSIKSATGDLETEGTIRVFDQAHLYANTFVSGTLLLKGANQYLNFNTTLSAGGYGLRDNAGTMQYKNSGGVWTDFFTGGSGDSLWTAASGYIHPDTSTSVAITDTGYLGIGVTNPTAHLTVIGNILLGGSSRYVNFDTTPGSSGYGFRDNAGTMQYKNSGGSWASFSVGGGGDSLWTAASGYIHPDTATGLVITDTNRLGIGTTGPDRALDILDVSNSQLRLTRADGAAYTDFRTDASGDLTITPSGGNILGADTTTFSIGGVPARAYNVIGDHTNNMGHSLASDDDLYIEGDLEVDGTAWFDGGVTATSIYASSTINFSVLTAVRLLAADAGNNLVSSDLANWIAGTTNQVTVTDDGDGTVTLSTAQDIHTAAYPTFAGLNADAINLGITAANEIDTDSGPLILDSNYGTVKIDDNFWVTGRVLGNSSFAFGGASTAAYNIIGDTTTNMGHSLASDDDLYIEDMLEVDGNAYFDAGVTVASNLYASSALIVGGSTEFNGIIYTWPSTDDNANYILSTNGAGALAWVADSTGNIYIAGNDLDLANTTFNIESQLDYVTKITNNSLTIGDGSDSVTISAANWGVTSAGAFTALSLLASGAIQGATLTDGTLTVSSGAITGGTTASFSGQIQGGQIAFDNSTLNSETWSTSSGNITLNPDSGAVVLADGDTINIGGADTQTYNVIGDTTTNMGHSLASDDDLYIEGDLEVDGIAWFDGGVTTTSIYATSTINLPNLTASRLIATDAGKNLVSSDAASWVSGTTNQITVTDDSDGTITLSTPQDIHTAANPTFAGLNADVINIGITSAFEIDTDSNILLLDSNSGTVKIDDKLYITGQVQGDSSFAFGGANTRSYNVIGDTTTNMGHSLASDDDLYIEDMLEVDGNAYFDAGVTVASNLYASSALIVGGTTEFNGITYTWPSTDDNANYILSTNGTGTLSWTADSTGNTYTAGNDLDLANTTFNIESQLDYVTNITNDTLTIGDGSDSVTISAANWGVSSAGSITAVSFIASGTIQGATLTDGTLSISSGAITSATTGTFSGQVQAGSLVFDNSTLNSETWTTSSGNITLNPDSGVVVLADGNTLNIGGADTQAYNVIGDTTTNMGHALASDDDLYIEGDLEVDGNTYFDGSVTVAQNLYVTTDLRVAGDTYFDSSGTTTFSGSVTVGGDVYVTNNEIIGGSLTVNNNLTIAGMTAGSVLFAGTSGLVTQDNDNLFYDATHNRLGVGSRNPTVKLEVLGNVLLGGSSRYMSFDTTPGSSGYGFRDNSGTLQFKNSGGSWSDFSSGTSLWTDAGPYIYPNNYATWVIGDTAGWTGIGVADPDTQLEVFAADTQVKISYDGTYYSTLYTGSSGDLTIYPSGGEVMVSGNLLPSATNLFDLGSSSYYWKDLYLEGNTIYFDDSTDAQIKYSVSNGEFVFDPDGDGTANVVFEDGGNVGIFTTGPDRKLDILDATNPQLRLTHTD